MNKGNSNLIFLIHSKNVVKYFLVKNSQNWKFFFLLFSGWRRLHRGATLFEQPRGRRFTIWWKAFYFPFIRFKQNFKSQDVKGESLWDWNLTNKSMWSLIMQSFVNVIKLSQVDNVSKYLTVFVSVGDLLLFSFG